MLFMFNSLTPLFKQLVEGSDLGKNTHRLT